MGICIVAYFSFAAGLKMFNFWVLGGLKLWEGSLDLVKALNSSIKSGHISFFQKRVLEVGFLLLVIYIVGQLSGIVCPEQDKLLMIVF